MGMIVKKEVRELPCQLNNEELADLSNTLAAKTMELAELEDRKKSVASDFKAKIDQMAATNNVIARKVNSKTDLRQVECVWQFDWENGKKTLFRTDTGEQIAADFIKDFEMQTHFDDLKKGPEPVPVSPSSTDQPPTAAEPAQLMAPQNVIDGECQDVTPAA